MRFIHLIIAYLYCHLTPFHFSDWLHANHIGIQNRFVLIYSSSRSIHMSAQNGLHSCLCHHKQLGQYFVYLALNCTSTQHLNCSASTVCLTLESLSMVWLLNTWIVQHLSDLALIVTWLIYVFYSTCVTSSAWAK